VTACVENVLCEQCGYKVWTHPCTPTHLPRRQLIIKDDGLDAHGPHSRRHLRNLSAPDVRRVVRRAKDLVRAAHDLSDSIVSSGGQGLQADSILHASCIGAACHCALHVHQAAYHNVSRMSRVSPNAVATVRCNTLRRPRMAKPLRDEAKARGGLHLCNACTLNA
jgi:hypothetical protein